MSMMPDPHEQNRYNQYQNYARQPVEYKDRGTCLTLWLFVSIFFASISLIGGLCVIFTASNSSTSNDINSSFYVSAVLLFGVIALFLVSCIAIWNWKEWGIWGFVVATILSPIVETLSGRADVSDFIAPFIQLGIFYFLIRSRWSYFE